MELQCKVIRGETAMALEEAVNRFLAAESARVGEIQFEEITQSEGASGVTIVIWYSRATAEDEELEVPIGSPGERPLEGGLA
jgi:hypothetical protein